MSEKEFTRVVEIKGEGDKVVDKVFHELVKETQNAARYGHNVEVREIDLKEYAMENVDLSSE